MEVVKPTERADVARATGLGETRSGDLWTLVLIACRRLGPQARVVVRPETDRPPFVGIESSVVMSDDDAIEEIRFDSVHHPVEGSPITDATELVPADDSTRDIDTETAGFMLSVPAIVEEVPRTSVTVTATETAFSVSDSLAGVDEAPSHLRSRSLREAYPFESQYFVYLVEGMRLFERVDERLEATLQRSVDDLSTVVLDGVTYHPATLTAISEDGIETTHYSLDGEEVIDAFVSGGLVPPDLLDQVARTGSTRRGQAPYTDYTDPIENGHMAPGPPASLNPDYDPTWEDSFTAGDTSESDTDRAEQATVPDTPSEGGMDRRGEPVDSGGDSEDDQQAANEFGW